MLWTGASPHRCEPTTSVQTLAKCNNGISYLIVESTLFVEEIEELAIGFATPEVEVTNLEVTPDYNRRTRRT